MITGINESKTVTKHILYNCICKFDDTKCNVNQKWKDIKCKNPLKHWQCKEDCAWNPRTSYCEIDEYLKNHGNIKSRINYSVIACDEI